MGDAIRFWHRGDIVEVTDVPATTTVLEWLRRERVSMGTKEGCNEGDCGACAVVLGHPAADGSLVLSSVHACMLLMPMLHGSALFTVEDVRSAEGLHPVQQAMVDTSGSQCGFCTPGIVMSLWRMSESAAADGGALSADDVRDGLAGHICRCTGYRPIVEAGTIAGSAGRASLDRVAILEALARIPADEPLDVRAGGTRFVAPVSISGLLQARAELPNATLIAGGTDLVPDVPGRGSLPLSWIWTGRVSDLTEVSERDGWLCIGGGASIEDAWRALAERWPGLATGRRRFASPAVRCTGTMAGNLVTGSPVGDSAPALLALDARIVLLGPGGERAVRIEEFATGYRQTALAPGEIVSRIDVPLASRGCDVRMFKVARRFDNDIATVSAAFALQMDGSRVGVIRVAFGGMSDVTRRATAAEKALAGRELDRASLEAAQEALSVDFAPLSDHRGSAEYRMCVAQGLLERWWLQVRTTEPLPASATDVWATP